MNKTSTSKEIQLAGLAVSDGIVCGRAVVLNPVSHRAVPYYRIEEARASVEYERVTSALTEAARQIDTLAEQVTSRIGKAQANIFVAQKMMVEDPTLHGEIRQVIETEHLNAEAAIAKCLDRYEKLLQEVDNAYMSERAADIGELRRRLLDIMRTANGDSSPLPKRALSANFHIIVSEDLTPSDTVNLNTEKTLGFITEHGGPASHAAILARAMGVPFVSGVERVLDRINTSDELLLNGNTGEVFVNPAAQTLSLYPTARQENVRQARRVDPVPGFTVMANIGLLAELERLPDVGPEGIGLYRTEFELLASNRLLDEDEQYARYSKVVNSMGDYPIYMRLLDLGADKEAPYLSIRHEENPCLGLRGARLLLERPDLLRPHVRALARASTLGPIHVTYPMIIDVDQFLILRERVRQFIADIPGTQLTHGAMFEVPSACLLADELLHVADFGCIGTNDLVQYLFAIDRNNERVAGDFNPDKPVFWRLLQTVAEAAKRHNKPLSLCGEVGGQAKYTAKLIDLGIRCVSVSPRQVGLARLSARKHLATFANAQS